MRAEDKNTVLSLVKERVCREILGDAELEDEATNRRVEEVLGETIFLEIDRVEHEPTSRSQKRALKELISKRRKLFKLSAWGRRAMLSDFVAGFAEEVVGHWNDRVYGFATGVLPPVLSTLLNALSPKQLASSLPNLPSIEERIILDGEVEMVRGLYEHGTLIFAPTHISNLDSIILGYALFANGFPPVTYGAGINLFTNPMISYFMQNLGAYKVDRKKKNSLYKRVLKAYATATLELGYPNLFFPGGTRIRSGAMETHLKLGLLGCGLQAYINNLKAKKEKPKLFVVPVNLSYQIVLEAENLIGDHLKGKDKSRYIITDDEFARPKRVLDFIRNLFELDAKIYMTFGEPYDVFGNRIDGRGVSRDKRGREVDIAKYVIDRDGKPVHEPQRDAQYTRELGTVLLRAFRAGNTIMATHLLAFVVYSLMRKRHPRADLYRFLREARIDDEGLLLEEVEAGIAAIHKRLLVMESAGEIRIDDRLRGVGPSALALNGLKHLGIYHTNQVVERRGDRLFVADSKLLLYYRNRLINYGLESILEAPEIDR